MKLGRIARLYLPPTFVLTALTVPRTPHLGTGVHLLAGFSEPPSSPESAGAAGAGANPDGGLDAGEDAGDAGLHEVSGCGSQSQHLATTSTLGAGCC
jgi:hypothetical protein